MSKLVKLESENVKRVKAVCIEPDGKPVVVIGGNNGQGKTSVLDSIEYALGGKPSVEKPIRDGETKARAVVETDDLVVIRTFTEKGSRLEVQEKVGAKRYTMKSPQALLDKMTGKLAFDPMAFSRMGAKEQVATLKELVGLDVSDLDAKRQTLYEERTAVNREVKSLQAQFDGLPEPEGQVTPAEVSMTELAAELERRQEVNRANEEKHREIVTALHAKESFKLAVDGFEEQIQQLHQKLEEAKRQLQSATENLESLERDAECLEDLDIEEIRGQMQNAEANNEKYRAYQKRREVEESVTKSTAEAADLTKKIDEIDTFKKQSLAEADFPVDGLAFDDQGVTFNGQPWQQCSSAEQLRVSVAMGLAMNPDIKILLIRDGSLMDETSLRMVEEMAAAADATILIERVGEGEECSVIIEDGMVKA